MAYADVAALAADPDFTIRTVAAYATETLNRDDLTQTPEQWQAEHAWDMAAQPGFGDAYASAIAGGIGRPGHVESVISDAQILAAVQPLIPALAPEAEPEDEAEPEPDEPEPEPEQEESSGDVRPDPQG